MFDITLEIGTLPDPAPMLQQLMRGMAQEIGAPIVGMMKRSLLRDAGRVPAAQKVAFNAYVNSIMVREATNGSFTVGGSAATETTATDLEFGEHGMPFSPHMRPLVHVMEANAARVLNKRMDRFAQAYVKGIKRTIKKVK